jgi:hypothetical protein
MSQIIGSVKSGVMLGLLQHPSIVQQMQQLQPDMMVVVVILMSITVWVCQKASDSLSRLVEPQSLWRGLVNLAIITFEPAISFLQMTIGMLLVRTIMYYTDQDFVGSVLTFSFGIVLDAMLNYKAP